MTGSRPKTRRSAPFVVGLLIGHSRPWLSGQTWAAMRRLPAVQPLTAVNDRLSLQATAGPDPQRPDAFLMGYGGLPIVKLPLPMERTPNCLSVDQCHLRKPTRITY